MPIASPFRSPAKRQVIVSDEHLDFDIPEINVTDPLNRGGQEYFIPQGNFIIVRNLPPLPISQYEQLVKEAISKIDEANGGDPLVPLHIILPSSYNNGSTFVHLSIDPSVDLDGDPRSDLLDAWIPALKEEFGETNVGWAECRPEKEKRCRVDIGNTGVGGKTDRKEKDEIRNKVLRHIAKEGWNPRHSYAFGELVTVVMGSTSEADKFTGAKLLPLDDKPLYKSQPIQYTIHKPGQVSIIGVRILDPSHHRELANYATSLLAALTDNRNSIQKSITEGDALHLIPDDWSGTEALTGKEFKTMFQTRWGQLKLHGPEMTFDINSDGVRRTTQQEVEKARKEMDTKLDDIENRIRKYIDLQINQVNHQFTLVTARLDRIEEVQNQHANIMGQFGIALVAMRTTTSIRDSQANTLAQITTLRETIRELRADKRKACAGDKAVIEGDIQACQTDIEELKEVLEESKRAIQELNGEFDNAIGHSEKAFLNVDNTLSSRRGSESQSTSASLSRATSPSPMGDGRTGGGSQEIPDLSRLVPNQPEAIEVDRPEGMVVVNQEDAMTEEEEIPAGQPGRRNVSPNSPAETERSLNARFPVNLYPSRRREETEGRKWEAGGQDWKMSWRMFLLTLILFVTSVSATKDFLSIYSINANGFYSALKVKTINESILARKPDIAIICETKTAQSVATRLSLPGYKIFENKGAKRAVKGAKWGILMAISSTIPFLAHPTQTDEVLEGRVIAVDLVLPDEENKGIPHRIIAAYAPCRIEENEGTRQFWGKVEELCKLAQLGWTIAGDLNATVTARERSGGGVKERDQYKSFLQRVNGADLWAQHPDRSIIEDFTCMPRRRVGGGSIIDRIATSRRGVAEGSIGTVKDEFVPNTDHRAIWGTVKPVNGGNLRTKAASLRDIERFRPPERIKMPSKEESNLKAIFAEKAEEAWKTSEAKDTQIRDGESFMKVYNELTKIVIDLAKATFGTKTRGEKRKTRKDPEEVRKMKIEIRTLGSIQRAISERTTGALSRGRRGKLEEMTEEYEKERGEGRLKTRTLHRWIGDKRKAKWKSIYRTLSQHAWEQVKKRDKMKILTGLRGSTKWINGSQDYVEAPLALNPLKEIGKIDADTDQICTGAEEVKRITTEYFSTLYQPPKDHQVPKPWMETPSVVEVKKRVEEDPLVWPQSPTLQKLRTLLRKGNPKPAPGMDGWEKWIVKLLPDPVLQRIADLVTFICENSDVPEELRQMILCIIHKRGIITALTNWRGVMVSNFIVNTTMAWANMICTDYAAEKILVPELQMVCQKGAQVRDQLRFILQLQCWARRHKQPIYALKRDQMKGFDFLSPKGFHDAIIAYGLPKELIDLDIKVSENVSCYPRTAYGMADPFIINGLTQQGGPLSPLKLVLTTSLSHRWVMDEMRDEEGMVVVKSSAAARGESHYPEDKLSLPIIKLEMMDDSILVGTKLEFLQKTTRPEEQFQLTYGWLTNWKPDKTKLYGVNLPANTQADLEVEFESVSPDDANDPFTITRRKVKLERGNIEFMGTRADDPKARAEVVTEIIQAFRFPVLSSRPPITLIRKVVRQQLFARIRAAISTQSLRKEEAQAIDSLITRRIHDMMGLPYTPNRHILMLPVNNAGLDFPSVTRTNAGLAVQGLQRDLNHHLMPYQIMAKITLADWTCDKNRCVNPLQGRGLEQKSRAMTGRIPISWTTAQNEMHELRLELRRTDESFVRDGEMAIEHLLKATCKDRKEVVTGTQLGCLKRIGWTKLNHAAEWREGRGGNERLEGRDIPDKIGRKKITKPQ